MCGKGYRHHIDYRPDNPFIRKPAEDLPASTRAVCDTVLLIVFGAIDVLQEDMSTQDAKKKGPLAEDPLQVPVLDAAFLCGEKAP